MLRILAVKYAHLAFSRCMRLPRGRPKNVTLRGIQEWLNTRLSGNRTNASEVRSVRDESRSETENHQGAGLYGSGSFSKPFETWEKFGAQGSLLKVRNEILAEGRGPESNVLHPKRVFGSDNVKNFSHFQIRRLLLP
jgi:hypothetical protein